MVGDTVIEVTTRTVYRAPTAKKTYITKRGAVHAEARALIKRKHPSEPPEPDVGYGGWTWWQLDRSDVLFRRMCRIVARGMFVTHN